MSQGFNGAEASIVTEPNGSSGVNTSAVVPERSSSPGSSLLEQIKNFDESICKIHFAAKLFISNYFQGLYTTSVSEYATTWHIFGNILNVSNEILQTSKSPDHRWHEHDSSIISLVLSEFTDDLLDLLITDSNSLTPEKILEIRQLTLKMRSVLFRQQLIYEIRELTYRHNISSRLDTNSQLMCFTNGVFDFATKQFRHGTFEDYVTMCTNYEYTPYDNYPDEIKSRLTSYLKSIFQMEANMEATLDILVNIISGTKPFVKCVLGGTGDSQFAMRTGESTLFQEGSSRNSGSNGKTYFIYLLKKMLGDYFKSVGSISSSENSKYRLLNTEYQQFPISNISNISTNIIMETNIIGCDSQVKIIPFMSRFLDNFADNFGHLDIKSLPRNLNIKSELEELAPVFMSMLIDKFLSASDLKKTKFNMI